MEKEQKENIKNEDLAKEKNNNWRAKKIKARFVCGLSICYLDKIIASVI